MSDIVERLRSVGGYFDKAALDSGVSCSEAANEIESLRQQLNDAFDEKQILSQRVNWLEKENAALESGISYEVAIRVKLEIELAALKQSQGEPVCYLREEWLSYEQSAEGQPGAFPVYTAPTIPEGWQILLAELLTIMEIPFDLRKRIKAMLAAAPAGPRPADYKPEDVK